ncbi:hypothetical protein D3C79_894270 [compost metagenome]
MVVPGERLGGIEQSAVCALRGRHFCDQAQHGRAAAALARDQVAQAACHGPQLVIDRAAFDAGDKHGDTPRKPEPPGVCRKVTLTASFRLGHG